MGEILGIKYKDSTFKPLTDAGGWVADTVSDGWDTITDSAASAGKTVVNTITGGVESGISAVTKTVQNVGRVGLSELKKYWYVPVIVGGVLIGYKMLGSRSTAMLLKQLTKN